MHVCSESVILSMEELGPPAKHTDLRRKTFFILLVGILFAYWLSAPPNLAAGPVFFDDFNAENGGNPLRNYTGFANWDVTRGTVDLIGDGLVEDLFDAYPGNGLYVDLDGSTFAAGRLESKTTFLLTAPLYLLEFDLGGTTQTGDNVVTVSLGTLFTETFSLPNISGFGSTPFTRITRAIPVASPTSGKLVFDHAGGDNYGLILDNVSLSAVPEPSSFVLVASCLALLVALRLRRLGLRRS